MVIVRGVWNRFSVSVLFFFLPKTAVFDPEGSENWNALMPSSSGEEMLHMRVSYAV